MEHIWFKFWDWGLKRSAPNVPKKIDDGFMAHFFFDFLTIFDQYKNIDSKIFWIWKKCANIEKFEELGLKSTP